MAEEPKEELEEVEEQAKEADKQTEEEPASNSIDRANLAAERLESANKAREALLTREEKLEVSRRLGGRSEAGAKTEKKKEETPEEYKERVMSGGFTEKER